MVENNLFYHWQTFENFAKALKLASLTETGQSGTRNYQRIINSQQYHDAPPEFRVTERSKAVQGQNPHKLNYRHSKMPLNYWWTGQSATHGWKFRVIDTKIWKTLIGHESVYFSHIDYFAYTINYLREGQVISWSNKRWKYYKPMVYPNICGVHGKKNL